MNPAFVFFLISMLGVCAYAVLRGGRDERLGAILCCFKACNRTYIGTSHDQEVRIAAALDGRANAAHSDVEANDLFAIEVTASFWIDVVFNVQARDPSVLHL